MIAPVLDIDRALTTMPGFERLVDEADLLGFTLTAAFPRTRWTWGTMSFTSREPPAHLWSPRPELRARYDGDRWFWNAEGYAVEFESASAAHVFVSLGGWDR